MLVSAEDNSAQPQLYCFAAAAIGLALNCTSLLLVVGCHRVSNFRQAFRAFLKLEYGRITSTGRESRSSSVAASLWLKL